MRIVLALAMIVIPLSVTIACGGDKKPAETGGQSATTETATAPTSTDSAYASPSASSDGSPATTTSGIKSPE